MARQTKSTEQMALTDWVDWESNELGRWSWDQIKSANLAFQSRELWHIATTLNAIQAFMVQLGTDGIHDVLRHHKRKAVRAQQVAAAKRRQRRAKALARKKVA